MNKPLTRILVLAGVVVASGCAARKYEAAPLAPADSAGALMSRTLSDEGLKTFLEKNLGHAVTPWPQESWDLSSLTLAALYFSPQMQSARAQVEEANAALITAGVRPNPTLSLTPGVPSPYLFGLDFAFPVETHGKRGIRIAQAQALSDAARVSLAAAAWKVRSQVRAAFAEVLVGEQRARLLRAQNELLTTQVQLLQRRLVAGEIGRPEVEIANVTLVNGQLTARQAEGQAPVARASLAAAVGVPVAAVESVQLSWPDFQNPPAPDSLPVREIEHEAAVNRLDVRAALLQYAAAEQALRLEIARQYPDVSIGPGYQLEERNSFFTVGFSTVLPVFNRNQGPIAEAEAARKKAAADFLAVQAQGIAQADAALAGYRSPFAELDQAKNALTAAQTERLNMQRRSVAVGESDQLELHAVLMENSSTALLELDALSRAQSALGALEDALQRPLQGDFALPQSLQPGGPNSSEQATPAANRPAKGVKP